MSSTYTSDKTKAVGNNLMVNLNHFFSALPPAYLASLQSQPSAMERLIQYHTINKKIHIDSMVGEQSFQSGLDARLKINVFRNASTVDTFVDNDSSFCSQF